MSILINGDILTIGGNISPVDTIEIDGEMIIFADYVNQFSDITALPTSITGGTADDLIKQDLVNTTIQPDANTVNTANPGQYVLTYNYTDSDGDSADSKQLTVTVVDVTAPVLSVTGSATTTIEVGDPLPVFVATAIDNTTGDISADIVRTGAPDNSTVGNYTYTYNVSDIYGNAATAVTRTVNVVDTTAPLISLVPNQFIYNVSKGDVFTLPVATFTDNYDQTRTLTPSSNNVNTSAAGVYTVTYSAIDDAGNSAISKTITVNVFDTDAIKSSSFTVDDNHIYAYSGKDNISVLKFTPDSVTSLDVINGDLDLSENQIKRIEIINSDGKLTSDEQNVTIDGQYLKAKMGKLPGVGRYELTIIAVLLSDEEIVIAGAGMPANIVLDLHE